MRSPEQTGADKDRDPTIREDADRFENDEPLDEEETTTSDRVGAWEGEVEEEEDEETDADEIDDSDLNLLIAMAEMDAEAAEAYRIAAEGTDQVHFRTKLEEFRGDHMRHVEALNELIADAGGPEISTELDEESSAVTMLAASMAPLGVRATLLAMIANERLTNTAYQASTELPFEDEVATLLEQHRLDEQRHLEWLTDQVERVRDDELDDEANADDV
jgi:rubrerythrin